MICPNCQTVNPDSARFCFNCGTALHASRSAGAERKLVTILFADVVGSTAMGENLDPEDVTEIMNGAFTFLNTAVAEQYGTVARLMGDAVLAFFGTPMAREDDAERAVRAGLQMQELAKEYALGVQARFGVEFRVRVGINTGLALLDIVGDRVRAEFTAMGDAVNLASRLQHAAPPGGILFSHDTYRHVRGLFEASELEPIHVKGKAEPVRVYQVFGARPRAFRVPTRGVAGIEAPMVGREAELLQLQEVFQGVESDAVPSARMVTIVGEAGVGKSRLLYEFIEWLNLRPGDVRLLKARASEGMVGLPYSLIRDLFAFEYEIQESDSESVAKGKLERGILEAVGEAGADLVPFLGHLIGFDYSGSSSLRGILDDARQIRDRAFQVVAQVVAAAAEAGTTVMALEDLHWADDGSLELIEHVLEACSGLPLMIVAIARPTLFERSSFEAAQTGRHVWLELLPLSAEAARELVADLLHRVPDVPQALSELIVERAEGNPFYVEELIQMLIDQGVIGRERDRWRVDSDKLDGAEVPPTLTGVLQARLDGLPPGQRISLQRASVVGRVFWDEALRRLEDGDPEEEAQEEGDTAGALSGLRVRELIFPSRPSAFADLDEFSFKHVMLRDVVYESVLKRRRRTYHAMIAAWLSERAMGRGAEIAGRIGEHYERGEEPEQAAEWYTRAAKQAKDAYAPETASGYYRKALALRPVDPGQEGRLASWRFEVYEGLGQVLGWLGRYEEAIEAYGEMRRVAEDANDPSAAARSWHGMAETQLHRGEFRAAVESADQEEAAARRAGADLSVARARWIQAWSAFRRGDVEAAQPLAEEVWELSSQLEDREQMAHALNLLGVLQAVSGRNDEAAVHFERALEIFRALGNRRRAMPLLNNLGVIAEGRGDDRAAYALYEEALRAAREMGNRDGEMVYLSNLGAVKARLGDHTSAEVDLLAVIHMAGSSRLDVLPYTYSFLAEAQLGQGRDEEALDPALHALALGKEMESQQDIGMAWRVLGKAAAALGRSVQIRTSEAEGAREWDAEACFAESERIFREIDRKEEQARTLAAWGRYAFDKGDRSRGQELRQEAKEIFEQLGADLEVQRLESLLAAAG